MHDCSRDILTYHNEKVTLPSAEQNEMRERRNANRNRLRRGLRRHEKPMPFETRSQGSYAMKTMVQHPEKDYDIDDGVYFAKEDLVGARGAYASAREARKMVRDAVDDGSFRRPPEVRNNCVRVYYDAGYHVDLPVYRRLTVNSFMGPTHIYELASTDWKRSDARDVTEWFRRENRAKSPDTSNGRQLRRVVRLLKKYSKSRESWSKQILSGFGITKLVVECFQPNLDREDRALYDTMVAINNRLDANRTIAHPVTPNETITNGYDDATARFLRDRLAEALRQLAPLFESQCTRAQALNCWDRVFNTDFFSQRKDHTSEKAQGFLEAGFAIRNGERVATAVRKEGGGRYG